MTLVKGGLKWKCHAVREEGEGIYDVALAGTITPHQKEGVIKVHGFLAH